MNTVFSNIESNELGPSGFASSSRQSVAKKTGITSQARPNAKTRMARKGGAIVLAAAAAVATLLGAAAPTHATPVTLTSGNSTALLNYNTDPSNADGLYNWTVDGKNQLNQQWFWFRVGSTGTQSRIDTLTQGTPITLDTEGAAPGIVNWVQETYTQGNSTQAQAFTVTTTMSLTGGKSGSGASDISETLKIVNIGTQALNYHFFEYSDFDLGNSTSGQTVTMSPTTGANTATQTGNSVVSETVVSPKSSFYEAGSNTALLTALNSTSDLQLNDTATASPADAAWAFEWDVVLNPGQSYLISVDKQIRSIPEPTSAVSLLGLGGIMLTRPRRRDEDPDPRTFQVAEA